MSFQSQIMLQSRPLERAGIEINRPEARNATGLEVRGKLAAADFADVSWP